MTSRLADFIPVREETIEFPEEIFTILDNSSQLSDNFLHTLRVQQQAVADGNENIQYIPLNRFSDFHISLNDKTNLVRRYALKMSSVSNIEASLTTPEFETRHAGSVRLHRLAENEFVKVGTVLNVLGTNRIPNLTPFEYERYINIITEGHESLRLAGNALVKSIRTTEDCIRIYNPHYPRLPLQ